MKNSKVKISYLGISSDNITDKLVSLFEHYSNHNSDLRNLSKKGPLLISECFQNIIKHSSRKNKVRGTEDRDYFQLVLCNDQVNISSKNLIRTTEIDFLNEKIDLVNSLDKKELREVWKKAIQEQEISDKGGAGLGIIEMARKTGSPLEKKIIKREQDVADFFFSLHLNQSENSISENNIDLIEEDYEALKKEGTIIKYEGDFSNETNSILIEMLHSNLLDEEQIDSLEVQNITLMIEMIENASKHGDFVDNTNEGKFFLKERNQELYVHCENHVNNFNKLSFEKYLMFIKSMDMNALKSEYKNNLKNRELTEEGNAGLGLLEIAIATENNFQYSFETINNNHFKFSLGVKLK